VTFVASAAVQACALPFLWLARRLAVPEDMARREPDPASPPAG